MLTATTYSVEIIMSQASYQIDLPQNPEVVVFYNGMKALNVRGFIWIWQQLITGALLKFTNAPGCLEAKFGICSPVEATIVSYWQDEASLMQFFHSPLHRQMMKNMMKIINRDNKAIALYNETYRPLRGGKYLNEPNGLARIYPPVQKSELLAKA